MSNLLNKKSLYDLKSRNVEGNSFEDRSKLYGPDSPSYNRGYDAGSVNKSPFEYKGKEVDGSTAYPQTDHLVALLDQTITSNRQGDKTTSYMSSVFGASKSSKFRPEDLDLEGNSLYPNYGGGPLDGGEFGSPGSTYENAQKAADPLSKF